MFGIHIIDLAQSDLAVTVAKWLFRQTRQRRHDAFICLTLTARVPRRGLVGLSALSPQRKGTPVNIRPLLCTAFLAVLMPTAQTAIAQQGIKVGALRCNVSGGLGLIITSSKEMSCVFTSASGNQEDYYGTIRKFGLDIGATDQGILAWDVFAPSVGPEPGALAGEYVGVDASATVGVGVGANVLVGSQRSFTLQPLSVQAQTGLALAGGVAALTLRPGP